MIVVSGSTGESIANAFAAATESALAETDIKRFPDGEVYTRITSPIAGKHVVIIQTTIPNANFVELLLLLDAAKQAGAAKLTAIVPYFAYARQDRVFKTGEAVSSRAVMLALAAQADEVITVDPHKEEILEFFPKLARSVTAVPLLASTLGAWGVDAILAPDEGARERAQLAAESLGVPFDHLEKVRLGPTEVEISTKDLDVAGKRVAIVDDMIASGGTMMEAAKQLKAQGATTVYAACTHGVFTGGAVPKLLAGGIDRVLCTDTLATSGCDVVSVGEVLAKLFIQSTAQ